jgi:hypothetical protein
MTRPVDGRAGPVEDLRAAVFFEVDQVQAAMAGTALAAPNYGRGGNSTHAGMIWCRPGMLWHYKGKSTRRSKPRDINN